MTDLLDRWGLIANYLRVSEKTARRYAQKKKRPLPIKYDPAGHPVITKSEADNWKRPCNA
jgi:hypothetical protein